MTESNSGTGVQGTYRIGVDARMLSEQITGIGRYNKEILSRLVEMGHQWFLYSHRPLTVGHWNSGNVYIRTSNISNLYLRMLWAQSILPYWANHDGLDLFWAPAHRIPFFLSTDIPRVVTVHDLVWKMEGHTMRAFSRRLDALLMPEAVRLADKVISVSQNTSADLNRYIPSSFGKVCTIPLGNTLMSNPLSRASLSAFGLDIPYFLFVGTLEPRKNLARLLEAFSRLKPNEAGGAVLAIAGGTGWGGVDVEDLVHQWGLQGRVRKLGYVSDQQLATLYEHALFLVMPSLYEGFGLPLLEAMSRGIPVLTSNISSMPEVAGDAGVLVLPHDVDSIARGLAALLGDTAFRLNLASRAVNSAARFSWDRAAFDTMATFEEAISVRQQKLASN